MKLYYMGAHYPTYRNLMKEMGIKDVSLNFLGLRQRVKHLETWRLEDKFGYYQNIFIDSGCQTLNNAKEQKYTDGELRDIADRYYSWVFDNRNRIHLYAEFDSRQLGREYIEETRRGAATGGDSRFIPIWNPDYGLEELNGLAERFGRIGILQTTIGGRDLVPHLNKLAKGGVKLHGLSMTKPDIMQAVPWESVSSTSWTSPARFGDSIVWSHGQLKRYPKPMKEQARKKERFVLQAAGFDWDKIQADDSQEMLRVSLWSWSQLIDSINKKSSRGVTTQMFSDDSDFTEEDSTEVDYVVKSMQNRPPTAPAVRATKQRDPSQKKLLPFLDFDKDFDTVKNKITGEAEVVEVPKLRIRSESMRICDSCFLAEKCPMFEPNSTCAYDIPIVIRTREQVQALMDSLVEMQAQRVLFMRMAEDIEGQGLDPILSAEIDRIGKLLKTKHDMEQEGFSLTVTAKQQGNMNRMDRLFGDMTKQSFGQLENATKPEDVVQELNAYPEIFEETF